MLKNYLQEIKNWKNLCSKTCENFILIGSFNAEFYDSNMNSFCAIHKFKILIKEPTCSNFLENPNCIDLILTKSWVL